VYLKEFQIDCVAWLPPLASSSFLQYPSLNLEKHQTDYPMPPLLAIPPRDQVFSPFGAFFQTQKSQALIEAQSAERHAVQYHHAVLHFEHPSCIGHRIHIFEKAHDVAAADMSHGWFLVGSWLVRAELGFDVAPKQDHSADCTAGSRHIPLLAGALRIRHHCALGMRRPVIDIREHHNHSVYHAVVARTGIVLHHILPDDRCTPCCHSFSLAHVSLPGRLFSDDSSG